MKTLRKTFLYFTLAFFSILSIIPQGAAVTKAVTNGTTINVNANAKMSWSRTFDWDISKSVTPNKWNLFKGDTGTSQYTVSVTKDQGTEAKTFSGEVTVENTGSFPTVGLLIYVSIVHPVWQVTLAQIPVEISSHPVLSPGEAHTYTYSYNYQGMSIGEYMVKTNVWTINFTDHLNTLYGPSTVNNVSSPSQPTLIYDTINVDDNEKSWTFSNTGSTIYNRTFSSSDAGIINNTATIRENGKSASASVTVNSYELSTTKTADAAFTRKYTWSIDKTGDKTTLNLQNGQSDAVNYSVALSAKYTDSNCTSSGVITIKNPAPIPAVINDISDIISPDIPVKIENLSLPLTLPAGSSLYLNYSSALPDSATRTNTVSVVQQNYAYNFDNTSIPTGTTSLTTSAAIDFSKAAVNEIDKTVSVTDDKYGFLGNISYSSIINPFAYQLVIGTYMMSGTFTFTNTATFVTNDTKTTGSDSWVVTSYVNSGAGTRTIGYWKNHPENIAKLLPIYLGNNSGTKTMSVSDTTKAVDIISMNVYGKQNNGITKLYAQLLAAKLNIRNGVDPSAINATIIAADNLLSLYDYNDWAELSKSQKESVLNLMNELDKYNNGLIGPGHAQD